MPSKRLNTILESGLVSQVVCYRRSQIPVAYVFEVSDQTLTHFWFSFYDLFWARQSLGMWLMLDSAYHARQRQVEYLYLGTVYGERALYKTAFANLEFWDGECWLNGVKKIKQLGREDSARNISLTGRWKEKLELFD